MYKTHANQLNMNLRLKEAFLLIFLQFHWKTNRNKLETILEATYRIHLNKYIKVMNLNFRDEISDMSISVDFCT